MQAANFTEGERLGARGTKDGRYVHPQARLALRSYGNQPVLLGDDLRIRAGTEFTFQVTDRRSCLYSERYTLNVETKRFFERLRMGHLMRHFKGVLEFDCKK